MVSITHFLGIIGLILVSLVLYTQQEVLSKDGSHLNKRRIDGNTRTSIPLFRGSNLGIFVRKRPFAAFPEHTMYRRKESRAIADNDENVVSEELNANEQQRRFDDYAENPGPMFGR